MAFSIYGSPTSEEPLDQGDLIEECPLLFIHQFDVAALTQPQIQTALARIIVLTQTCDLAQQKAQQTVVAPLRDAQRLVDEGVLKTSDIRGPLRAGRVWGWYFLPASRELNLPEMIVDFRQLHTVRVDLLLALCRAGRRRARVQPLYREHLSRHLAETYGRIGLPEPYPTL